MQAKRAIRAGRMDTVGEYVLLFFRRRCMLSWYPRTKMVKKYWTIKWNSNQIILVVQIMLSDQRTSITRWGLLNLEIIFPCFPVGFYQTLLLFPSLLNDCFSIFLFIIFLIIFLICLYLVSVRWARQWSRKWVIILFLDLELSRLKVYLYIQGILFVVLFYIETELIPINQNLWPTIRHSNKSIDMSEQPMSGPSW